MRLSVLISLGIALLLAPLGQAQRYVFQTYGQDQGLSNLAVMTLAQDHTGFLWVGTQNGLCRYGGVRVTCFSTAGGLPSSYIRSIAETPDGVLLIGTRTGLARRARMRVGA